ncbi:pyridoxal phosphate-dependent transferase [Tuber brumale]|nr:pyridoxal phosphate-dependent transferase [Tuber brumale]
MTRRTLNSYTMPTAAKVVQCIASFSRASLSPALTLRRGLTVQLYRGPASSSGRDAEAVAKVDPKKRRMYASNFMKKKTGPNPTEVGNSLMGGVLKQTTITDTGSRPICLDMQVTTPTVPHVLDAITGLYRNHHSCTHTYGWETMKGIDVARQQAAKLLGAHPMEIIFTPEATESNKLLIKYVAMIYKFKKHIITSPTEHMCVLDSFRHLQDKEYDYKYLPVVNNGLVDREHSEKVICPDTAPVSILMVDNEIRVIQAMEKIGKLCRKNRDFFCTRGAQSVGNIPVDVGKWNDDLMSISGPKVYGPKDIRTRYTRHRPKVRIDPLISGSGQGRGLRSGTHAHSLVFAFGGPCRISQEENEYTCTSNPFFPQNSICSSTMQGSNYIHKRYHNKQQGQFTRTLWAMGHYKADMKTSKCKATTEDSRAG